MCMSSSPAIFTNTSIYAAETKFQDKYVHVLGYQNMAQNLNNGPNAMILPLPSAEEMGPENMVDTRNFKSFFSDMKEAFTRRTRSMSFGTKSARLNYDSIAQVFDVGSYTVVLAKNAQAISEALERVPENKRPKLSESFLEGFKELYPNSHLAVCCWDGTVEAEPLLWWYEPLDKNNLFIPTMDAHDGNAPDLNAKVTMDHSIFVGSTLRDFSNFKNVGTVRYTQNNHAYNDLFSKNMFVGLFKGKGYNNGDMKFDLDQLDPSGENFYTPSNQVVLHRNSEQHILNGHF